MIRRSPAPPARPGCPHRRLHRLLERELPPAMSLGASTLRPWASANFIGARHLFPCNATAGDVTILSRALHGRLSAIEWRLPGHIVADIAVEPTGAPGILQIEILTVED